MKIIKKLISQKIILFTLAIIINSCGIYVQYDYDSDVDFNNYNSYSFYEPDIEKVEISDLDKKRILKSLDMGLKSKGLERSNSPDLLVTFETQSKERVYVNNYLPYGWSPFFTDIHTHLDTQEFKVLFMLILLIVRINSLYGKVKV